MLKAIGFDLGHTLFCSQTPLNWQALYRSALVEAMQACGIPERQAHLRRAEDILTRYNTRTNPREGEVAADVIFGEVLSAWQEDKDKLPVFKEQFFKYFGRDVQPYPDARPTLQQLRQRGIKVGVFTNAPYGMDKELMLRQLQPIADLVDACFTSVDVGHRKPNPAGYVQLLNRFGTQPWETAYVGDEADDMLGAARAAMVPVLINRTGRSLRWGQAHTIANLNELPDLLDRL